MRDLTHARHKDVARERARVADEGWGARFLALQNADGGWGDGIYSPKWTSTTYTLLHLLWLGLPARNPAALKGCERLWEWRERWRAPETCIVSMLIRLTSAHGYPAPGLDDLVQHLLDEQLDDGGWNCRARKPTDKGMHSSFHTSIQALEGLHAYSAATGADTSQAQTRGREFFLRHRLYQSHRTGAVAIPASLRFPAFPEWHFDVMRGLEYFCEVGAERDNRLRDAIGVVEHARRPDGRWSTYSPYAGRHFFQLERAGASRWNTYRALRVLDWFTSQAP